MTETAPGATFLEARESVRHIGSAGLPVFFADVRCVRPDLTDTDPDEPGEVLVRGPNVTPGYWNDPQATRDAFAPGGWLRSGDIARVDADGHYHVVDRVKDMYISGGENVYPAEVEATLMEHPAVVEAAVVAVPHDRWGEAGVAVVAVRAPVDPDALVAWCGERLARFKVPCDVRFVDRLPRSGMGKVAKAELLASLGVGADHGR
jgi:fatty-acyl-CoA synthase